MKIGHGWSTEVAMNLLGNKGSPVAESLCEPPQNFREDKLWIGRYWMDIGIQKSERHESRDGTFPFVLQTPVDPPQSTAATAKTATNANTATICYPTATANTAAATLLLLLMLLLLMLLLLLLLGFLQWRLSRKGMQRLPMCNWLPGWPLSLDYFFRDSQTLHQEYQSWSIMYKRMVSEGTFLNLLMPYWRNLSFHSRSKTFNNTIRVVKSNLSIKSSDMFRTHFGSASL